MIAQAGMTRVQPVDCGVIFPYGRGGRNLRVFLLTGNAVDALGLGQRLVEWGLIHDPKLIMDSHLETALVQNYQQSKRFEPMLGRVDFPLIKFAGAPIGLGTRDPEEVMAFSRWLVEKNDRARAEKEAKQKAEVTLKNLADAGEIETIE